MSNPSRALDEQALLHMRVSTPEYQRYMTSFLEDVQKKGTGPVWADPKGNPSGQEFCRREGMRLGMAEAYFLAADMMPVVKWAAAGLDGTDRFAQDLWPTEYGFLWLEDPLLSSETWGRAVVTKAVTWGRVNSSTAGPGVIVVWYTDMDDERDEVNQHLLKASSPQHLALMEKMGHLHVHHTSFIGDDQRVGPQIVVPPEDYAKYADNGQTLTKEASNDHRFLLAFLMLLGQKITAVSTPEQTAREQKRWRRMPIPGKVNIVRLRTVIRPKGEGESTVEWAHKFIVGQHWKWQPYGPRVCEGGGEDHAYGAVDYEAGKRVRYCTQPGCPANLKRIWIAPYVKNADLDLPFKQTTKVRALVR